MGRAVSGPDNDTDEQALDLVAGQRDQVARRGAVCVFVGADHCEEGTGQHREGDPAGPGRVAADLVLIRSGLGSRPHGAREVVVDAAGYLACPSLVDFGPRSAGEACD